MSRKLDAAIAEALGYELLKDEKRPGIAWTARHPCGGTFKEMQDLRRYSTNGNAMMELDREMRERGWELHVTRKDIFKVMYCNLDTGDYVYAIADTMPKAVALATYKALTGKE